MDRFEPVEDAGRTFVCRGGKARAKSCSGGKEPIGGHPLGPSGGKEPIGPHPLGHPARNASPYGRPHPSADRETAAGTDSTRGR
jgi:hypothetical protein